MLDFDVYLIKTDADGSEQWHKTFEGGRWDHGFQQTRDSGYIIVGDTSSFGAGGADIYLIKTDASGNKQMFEDIPDSILCPPYPFIDGFCSTTFAMMLFVQVLNKSD